MERNPYAPPSAAVSDDKQASVPTIEGRTPRFPQILGRSLARLIPFEAFSFFGALGVGWHDSFSNTRVIRTRKS